MPNGPGPLRTCGTGRPAAISAEAIGRDQSVVWAAAVHQREVDVLAMTGVQLLPIGGQGGQHGGRGADIVGQGTRRHQRRLFGDPGLEHHPAGGVDHPVGRFPP